MSQRQGSDNLPAIIKALQRELGELQRSFNHGVELVEKLPENPVDGQEVHFQNAAMAASGVVWRLRYRAESTSSHKWEFIGGSPMYANESGSASGSSSGTFALGGNEITVPITGDYEVEAGGLIHSNGAAGLQELIMYLFAGASSLMEAGRAIWTAAWEGGTVSKAQTMALTSGWKLNMRVIVSQSVAWSALEGWIKIRPVRVG